MIHGILYAIIGILGLNALLLINSVGKIKKAITPDVAAVAVGIYALEISALVYVVLHV